MSNNRLHTLFAICVLFGWKPFYLHAWWWMPLLYQLAPGLWWFLMGVLATSMLIPSHWIPRSKSMHNLVYIARKFFRYHVYMEAVPPDQAIYTYEPHDILPVGMMCVLFLRRNIRLCVSSSLFYVPGLRWVLHALDVRDVSRASLESLLTEGYSPLLCPGGVREVTMMESPREIVLPLSCRTALVALAVTHQVPLVPIFALRQRDAYRFWIPPWGWLHKLIRRSGSVICWCQGWGGIPFGLPRPISFEVVVGRPISPTQPDLQTVWIESFRRLFQQHGGREEELLIY